MTTAIAFLIVLSILIFVHEFGHFIMARFMGVRVLTFSFGFGPRIWGVKKGDTDYCLSLYPLGGFVKLFGDNPEDEISKDEEKWSFTHKPVWRRALIVIAGPAFNIFFAWLVFFVILASIGNPILLPEIGGVNDGSPAQVAGLMKDDRVISINNKNINSWEEMTNIIKKDGAKSALNIKVKRGSDEISFIVPPQIKKIKNPFGEEIDSPIIGITSKGSMKIESLNPIDAFAISAKRLYEILVLTIQGFIKLFQGILPLSTLGGPILIGQMAGEQLQNGLINFVYFIALLSVNLGVLNLLPIPILDGGHLVFYTVEAIRGKALTIKQMELAQKVGMAILGLLMIIVFYNDIARLIGILPPLTPP